MYIFPSAARQWRFAPVTRKAGSLPRSDWLSVIFARLAKLAKSEGMLQNCTVSSAFEAVHSTETLNRIGSPKSYMQCNAFLLESIVNTTDQRHC